MWKAEVSAHIRSPPHGGKPTQPKGDHCQAPGHLGMDPSACQATLADALSADEPQPGSFQDISCRNMSAQRKPAKLASKWFHSKPPKTFLNSTPKRLRSRKAMVTTCWGQGAAVKEGLRRQPAGVCENEMHTITLGPLTSFSEWPVGLDWATRSQSQTCRLSSRPDALGGHSCLQSKAHQNPTFTTPCKLILGYTTHKGPQGVTP